MTDMKKIDDKKRRVLISVVVLILFLTLAGGTFAYLVLGIDIFNGDYISKTKCFDIVYDNKNKDGTMDIEGTLVPSADYSGGLSGSMAIGSSCNVSASGNLIVHLNSSDSILTQQVEPHCENAKTLETLVGYTEAQCKKTTDAIWVTSGSALKYMVFEEGNNNAVSVGYIDKTNEDIKIYKNFRIRNKVNEETGELELSKYTIYIWLDFNISDSSYSFASFSGYMYADASQNPPGQPNAPELDPGMIPVTIADDGTVTTVSPEDPNWYNYEEKQWANVVLVNKSVTSGVANSHPRSYYQNNVGVEVNQDDILAYYVWIPRYKYRMPQPKCSSIPENERNMEDYPECYAPYTLTDDEKTALIRYRADDVLCMSWYEDDQINAESTKDIELGLSTGRLSDGQTIQSLVEGYKNYYLEYDGYYDCGGGEEMSISEITLTPSDFNGNITYTTKEGTIDILFEGSDEVMKLGNAKTEYRSHPSFWWDDDNDGIVDNNETIAGIWVGKFETTPDKSSACYTTANISNCNNSTQNPTILPDTVSLRYQDVSNQFYTSRNISKEGNIYGLNNTSTNAHMMKNRDWGAVVYLSHSEYGINKEVYANNRGITGRSDGNERTGGANSCTIGTSYTWLGQTLDSNGNPNGYAADRTKGTNASTTGNVTGIYDMSGGKWENVMGHYGNTVYIDEEWADDTGEGLGDHSGFEELPELKYYDLYSDDVFIGTYQANLVFCTIETCGGHALNETVGWYNNDPTFVYKFGPWVKRGNDCASNASIFSFGEGDGNYYLDNTWRSVLALGFGD